MKAVHQKIKKFFKEFEKAINANDVNAIASLYAESFLFGDWKGTQAIKKEHFLQVIPKRQDFFAIVGLKETRCTLTEETTINTDYVLVKVGWRMKYEKEGKEPLEDDTVTTYILFSKDDRFQIVLQIDHQDLMVRVKELGLTV